MTTARSAILDRVRSAQRTGRIPVVPTSPNHVESTPAAGSDQCLERFLAELTALGVDHYVETSSQAVSDRVRAIVAGHSVLAWNQDRLPHDIGPVLGSSEDGSSPRDRQAAAEIGVSGCDAAIAETGSLVLLSGTGQPRAASLLPAIHVAVVRRGDVLFSMREFFEERVRDIRDAACCTFIAGPSRTADIELTLTLGVHGPGRVIVVIGP